jgi:predicted CXXCH cytochrome family protein
MEMQLRSLTIAVILLLTGGAYAAEDYCFGCHSVMEGMSLVFKDDVHYHKGLSCSDCHGGDPKINDMNLSKTPETGFRRRATRETTPAYCGRCHSDPNFVVKYNSKLRVDQLALYTKSVHGTQLAAGHTEAAECVDCHSVHNIRAVSDPCSPANPKQVTETCAKCHVATADAFRESPHGHEFTYDRRPGCATCHASHATEPATTAMLTGKDAVCVRCHRAGSDGAKAATEIGQLLTRLETADPNAKEALARARVAVHTFDAAAVKRAADSARVSPKGIQK